MSALEYGCTALAALIKDYQQEAPQSANVAHVVHWVTQFPEVSRLPIINEMLHVMGKSYFSKERAIAFLEGIITSKKLCGEDYKSFWRSTRILQLQTQGNSQRELLKILETKLFGHTGFSLNDCGQNPSRYLYLDDGLFSGGRIKSDLTRWINDDAPAVAEVYIVVIAAHSQGAYFTLKDLRAAAKAAGKALVFKIRYKLEIGDKIFNDAATDVLRPTGPGPDAAVSEYIDGLGKAQQWRTVVQQGACEFFTGEAGRSLLEQEFLREGVGIRAGSPYLNDYQRPLGNTTMRTTGFGTLFVTWRNCPNNAPLVLWAGNPWYPLFRRITN